MKVHEKSGLFETVTKYLSGLEPSWRTRQSLLAEIKIDTLLQ